MKCNKRVAMNLSRILTQLVLNLAIFIGGAVMLAKTITFYAGPSGRFLQLVGLLGSGLTVSFLLLDLSVIAVGMVGCYFMSKMPSWPVLSLVGIVFWAQALTFTTQILSSEQMSQIGPTVAQTLQKSYGNDPAVTTAFDRVQQSMECCGSSDPKSWAFTAFNHFNGNEETALLAPNATFATPISCCSQPKRDLAVSYLDSDRRIKSTIQSEPCPIFKGGCSEKIHLDYRRFHLWHSQMFIAFSIVQFTSWLLTFFIRFLAFVRSGNKDDNSKSTRHQNDYLEDFKSMPIPTISDITYV